MALLTAQDFIYIALRKIGAIRPGYIAGPELMADALSEWTLMFDELNTSRLNQYSNPDAVYPVTGPGHKSSGNGYSIGPTGEDWVGPRPTSIVRANLVYLSTGSTTPVYIPLKPISQETWAGLAIRKIPATSITSLFWYDPQFPNGVFNVFPPLLSGNSIEIFQFGALNAPTALSDLYSGPPGYAHMVAAGLAERLYHMVDAVLVAQKRPYNIVQAQAINARAGLQRLNRPVNTLASDFPSQTQAGYYDSFVTYTGEPY